MGVQLMTDDGPVTVTWTSTFFPYCVEVFLEPIDRHLILGECGPQRIGPDSASRWEAFLGSPIHDAVVWWQRLKLGPTVRMATGEVIGPPSVVEVLTALRLDFEAGQVWFVGAIPQYPRMEPAFIPGDEIMIVLTSEKMFQMDFTSSNFAH